MSRIAQLVKNGKWHIVNPHTSDRFGVGYMLLCRLFSTPERQLVLKHFEKSKVTCKRCLRKLGS